MVIFIDDHRLVYGVELLCKVLPIAPSTYYACKRRQHEPSQRSERAWRDEQLCEAIQHVRQANHQVYGPVRFGFSSVVMAGAWPAAPSND